MGRRPLLGLCSTRMNIPGFIARRFYVPGSLGNTDRGFSLQAHNPMGEGTLVGVGSIEVDGRPVDLAAVSAVREGDEDGLIEAAQLSRQNPIRVRAGDRVTLHVAGPPLSPGEHRLSVELEELSIGRLRFSIRDRLAAATPPFDGPDAEPGP